MDAPAVNTLRPLTSLRFFAALMIVLVHAKDYFSWPWLQLTPFALGHGVSFFFVLSGFILTHVYTATPIASYWRFVVLRVGRLWPVHALATLILVASMVTPLIIVRRDMIFGNGPGIFNRWYELVGNLLLLHSFSPYVAHFFSWNSVSWSISTEFAFYLVFPLLVIKIGKTWGLKLAAGAGLAMTMLVLDHFFIRNHGTGLTEIVVLYANPFFRGFEFCLGMSAYVLWHRHVRTANLPYWTWTAVEISVILLAVAWLYMPFLNPDGRFGSHFLMANWIEVEGSCWVFAILIVTLASGRGLAGRLLALWPLVFLGEISYSVYMLHQILMKAFFTYGLLQAGAAVFFGVLLVVCTLSYALVERPARNAVRRATAPRRKDGEVALTANPPQPPALSPATRG